jgi:replication factor A1
LQLDPARTQKHTDSQVAVLKHEKQEKKQPREKTREQKTMRSKLYPSEYLALLTIKYELDPDKFFNALMSAYRNRTAQCGELHIQCRSRQNHQATLLITHASRVVAQFKLPTEFLTQQKNPIKTAKNTILTQKQYQNKKQAPPRTLQIKDLKPGMKNINLNAKITSITKPQTVTTRYGNQATVANATLTDPTGQIKLTLWNNQIQTLTTGTTIQIQNANITTYKNQKQLHINKNTTLHTTQNKT